LERGAAARNDIEFDVQTIDWQVDGDAAGMSRASQR
jgi:two-component system sensor histidine kinase MprB